MEGIEGYRQCLQVALAALLNESGFEKCDGMAMETLTEMTAAFLHELGRSGKAYCELAARSEPLGADIVLALTEMGALGSKASDFGVRGLREYALRQNRKCLGNPSASLPSKQPSMLHTGDRRKEGRGKATAVVPDYLPEYPDSHTYIRTPTHRQPEHDYESVREKAASQKRDVERALTRFIAKTCGKTHSLFNTDDTNLYPLISCDPKATKATATSLAQASQLFHNANPQQNPFGAVPDSAADTMPQLPPYVSALMFRDQLFEEDEREYLPKKKAKEDDDDDIAENEDETMPTEASVAEDADSDSEVKEKVAKPAEDSKQAQPTENPYLKPTRTPRNAIVGAQIPSQRRIL